jgi:hypothetical protein
MLTASILVWSIGTLHELGDRAGRARSFGWGWAKHGESNDKIFLVRLSPLCFAPRSFLGKICH